MFTKDHPSSQAQGKQDCCCLLDDSSDLFACVHLLLLSNCSISISNCICLGGMQVKVVCLLFSLFPQKFSICSTLSCFTLWFMPQVYLLTPLFSRYPIQNNQGFDRISFCSGMGEVTNKVQSMTCPLKENGLYLHKMSLLCLCSSPKKLFFPYKGGRRGKKEMIRLSPRGRRDDRW